MLIVRRHKETVVFECFEASPLASAVMECKGSLVRTFPAQARAVHVSIFDDPRFRNELAAALSKLDMEVVDEMMPQSQKAGSTMAEIRDTAHPGLVSDMLMAILASVGQSVQAQQLSKRTRDDVLWSDTLLPWRRSPLWLAIRVTIQITLYRLLLAKEGYIQYKNFMVCLMSKIASIARLEHKPADTCHVILAKIAHRVHKLDEDTLGFVQQKALDSCQRVKDEQNLEWEEIQKLDADRPTTVPKSNFAKDTALSLRKSRPHLDAALAHGQSSAPPVTPFTPNRRPSLGSFRGLPQLDMSSVTKEDIVFVLSEFENWVADSLPSWVAEVNTRSPAPEDCEALANLGASYWRTSEASYIGAPEQLSIMLLTIAELWYAIDRLAIHLFPLLKQYSPEVPVGFFNPLLLPKGHHMQRLYHVEQHIQSRHSHAAWRHPSVFSDPGSRSFAVAYYATSDSHKALRNRIEAEASTKKANKKSEWEEASQKHQRLISEADKLECQTITDDDGWPEHSPYCKKCSLKSQANAMRISKYEWPLPTDQHYCISAVFELDCPMGFVAWRNFTWMLTHDIGRPEQNYSDQYADTLHGYSGLRSYSRLKSSRLVLASKVKSFEKTHYTQSFPVRYDQIYSNNALQYAMLDDQTQSLWVGEQISKPSLHHKCVQSLPSGQYSNLQFAVDSTNHGQNQVLAKQDICSNTLSLHEFISFGSLRADGEHTQWLNIQRELTAPNLNLNTEAVSTLFLHAALQAGSSGNNVHRTSHHVLQSPQFCEEFLTKVGELLNTVEANWKTDYAMMVLVNLTLRVLSLASDNPNISLAIHILKRIRAIVCRWMGALRDLLNEVTAESRVQSLQQRLLKVGMLCKLTYDVDSDHISKVFDSDSDLSTWVFSCVLVRENVAGDATSMSPYTRRMYLHDQKLTLALHLVVLRLAKTDKNVGFDQGISKVWPGFQSASNDWHVLPDSNGRWVTTQTEASSGFASQKVLYNVLDGELLVDGRPLGRLPKEYLRSAIYKRVFGSQLLNVLAADMPGMLYMTSQEIHNYVAYFTLREGEVVIKLRRDSQTLEYLPHDIFVGDMPSQFVNDYAHWLDLSSHEIEFRPLEQLWTTHAKNWRLQYHANSPSYLFKGDTKLIDVRSITFARTMDVFRALDTWDNIHVSLGLVRLDVHFPRLDLHFFLNSENHFQCHELHRIIDPDQSLRSMIGLKSRLVLCGIGQLARKHDRLLIFPQGKPSISKAGPHVCVTISTAGHKIRLFRYQIDGVLRRLQGPGDITSTLYKAYLHAITSYVLPDPFTGNTGTEEALACLRSQAMRLSKPADEEIALLLTWISKLTPDRKLYPKHLRVMQQVQWNPSLSMIAQHDDFVELAQQILASGDRFLVFYPGSKGALYPSRDKDLLARARARNLGFCNSGSSINVAMNQWDVSYEARDHIPLSRRAANTFSVASLVKEWPQKCGVSQRLLQELQSLSIVSGFGTCTESLQPLSELLNIYFTTSWGSLLETCRSSSQQEDTYRLLFLFSMIAYGDKVTDIVQLPTLLAFAFSRELRAIGNPPPHASYTLAQGFTFRSPSVRTIIQRHMRKFQPSRRHMGASDRFAEERKYQNDKEQQINNVLDHYKRQWPCSIPQPPSAASANLLNINPAGYEINDLFAHWTRNGEFQDYINRAQSMLDRIYEYRNPQSYTADDWQTWQVHAKQDAAPSLHTLRMLMLAAPTPLPKTRRVRTTKSTSQASVPNPKLHGLVENLGAGRGKSSIRKQYSDELGASLDAYGKHKERLAPRMLPCSLEDLMLDRDDSERYMMDMLESVYDSLKPKTEISRILDAGSRWPRLTVCSVVSLLLNLSKVPPRWTYQLLALGEAITICQRARRLVLAGERNDIPSVYVELENVGRVGWSSAHQPEWLLIEIENDLLIRPNQAQVALEMLDPSSSSNSLTQLNMVCPLSSSAMKRC